MGGQSAPGSPILDLQCLDLPPPTQLCLLLTPIPPSHPKNKGFSSPLLASGQPTLSATEMGLGPPVVWVMEPHPSPVLEEGLSLIVAAHLHVPKGATRASDRGLDKPEVDGEASGRLYPEMAPPSLEPNQGLERDRVWHTMYVTALGLHPDAPALSVPVGREILQLRPRAALSVHLSVHLPADSARPSSFLSPPYPDLAWAHHAVTEVGSAPRAPVPPGADTATGHPHLRAYVTSSAVSSGSWWICS